MYMERRGIFLALTASLLMTACSMDLAITSLVDAVDPLVVKPMSAELVSGSTQYQHSNVRGYLIQSAVGAVTSDTVQVSNVRQYKLYQGVQAQMISEDPR
jgi:outer membrane biogenesis lipoprotein LolB